MRMHVELLKEVRRWKRDHGKKMRCVYLVGAELVSSLGDVSFGMEVAQLCLCEHSDILLLVLMTDCDKLFESYLYSASVNGALALKLVNAKTLILTRCY